MNYSNPIGLLMLFIINMGNLLNYNKIQISSPSNTKSHHLFLLQILEEDGKIIN
jgi:hypothetical protein